jgi:hypothetical protein
VLAAADFANQVKGRPAANTNQSIRQLVQLSDVILSGQVLSVDRDAAQGLLGAITVTLRVETAVRGVASGSFVARFLEDSPGSFTAHPDERLVLFLHAPNATRLTSLVAGGCGILERTGGDRVDLRRLQLCFAQKSRQPRSNRAMGRGPWSGQGTPVSESQSMKTSDLLRLLEHIAREPEETDVAP